MKLAINGGKPVREKPFPEYRTVGVEEKKAVTRVIDSGILSNYIASAHEHFMGGPEVRALEEEWASFFKVKHAIAVNSCTSGLYASVGAVGVEPYDEVIVSPYTMSASATAALIFGGIPVFADIEEKYFCLDPESVEARITPRTKAIIVVDIFGQPYDAEAINRIAKNNGLAVIEDSAQAPGALYGKKFAGTLADIGVYSLNYHKHIHCGEGGLVVTNNDEFADRIRLIRNHAEAVVEAKEVTNIKNMVGFNFRMTELEAAVARCQLKKLSGLIEARQKVCRKLAKGIGQIPAITNPEIRRECSHVFYVCACKFNDNLSGVSREKFVAAVKMELAPFKLRESEGVKISCGYTKPLYLQPMFQKKIAYGSKGYPFSDSERVSYERGICPVAERMYENDVFIHEFMQPQMSKEDINDVITAFEKVWENRGELS